MDVAAAAEYKGFLLGGEAGYDTAKSAVTKYNVALGYNAGDHQVILLLFLIVNSSSLDTACQLVEWAKPE